MKIQYLCIYKKLNFLDKSFEAWVKLCLPLLFISHSIFDTVLSSWTTCFSSSLILYHNKNHFVTFWHFWMMSWSSIISFTFGVFLMLFALLANSRVWTVRGRWSLCGLIVQINAVIALPPREFFIKWVSLLSLYGIWALYK